jgi:hypothetical protein
MPTPFVQREMVHARISRNQAKVMMITVLQI